MTERSHAGTQTVVAPRQDGRFNGKVAFVTGATSGIGRATALAFAREGASLVVADVATDGNRETARLIEQAGGQSLAVSCDVTRADDTKAALDAAVERFGRLDIAFNNAGHSSRAGSYQITRRPTRPPRWAIQGGQPAADRSPPTTPRRGSAYAQVRPRPDRLTSSSLLVRHPHAEARAARRDVGLSAAFAIT
jgi:NAD(P)-dependent dehydrogenase (short-subunit alcohol dehydrogenase family)